MDKQSQLILAVVAATAVAAYLYQKNQAKKKAAAALPPPATTDSNSANYAAEGRWVVGGYDAATNETYVFPEGNLRAGKRISGRLNMAQGTLFTPAAWVAN